MAERLIFIYDTAQAEYLIRNCLNDFFRIGKGNQGDVCVSFFDTQDVREFMTKWKEKIN